MGRPEKTEMAASIASSPETITGIAGLNKLYDDLCVIHGGQRADEEDPLACWEYDGSVDCVFAVDLPNAERVWDCLDALSVDRPPDCYDDGHGTHVGCGWVLVIALRGEARGG